jgi:hypothetical protein
MWLFSVGAYLLPNFFSSPFFYFYGFVWGDFAGMGAKQEL